MDPRRQARVLAARAFELEQVDEILRIDVGVRLLARLELAAEPGGVAVGRVGAAADRQGLRRVVHEPKGDGLRVRFDEPRHDQ